MKYRRTACVTLVMATIGLLATGAWAQSSPSDTRTHAEIFKSLRQYRGHIDLHGSIAALDLPAGYFYLNPADSETFLTKIFGNPPAANGPDTDGMILPETIDPTSGDGWAAVITYDASGHVSDSDAASTNFDDLLKTMQKGASDSNPDRVKNGFPTIELRGWAEPPHYDAEAKTLYWAERFKFGNNAEDTLNFKIRALGREGVLQLNVVDSIEHLENARKLAPKLLTMASFRPGSTYADFSSGTDKVAEYGIAGLIAGGVLLKAGFFKALLVGAAALWKPIAAGVVILLGAIGRIFRRGGRIKPGA